MSNLTRFLEQAEARLSKEPERDFQHEFLPDLERQAPLSVREAKSMVALLKAFAAVVEEAKTAGGHKYDAGPSNCPMCKLLTAADAAVAALSEEGT